jgi:hypothetical protein
MKGQVKSIPEIIERLGGVAAVADLVGVGQTTVYHWPVRGFPPETYVVLMRALELQGLTAPPSLWQMRAVAD